jgi:chemotaxis regulatin CheY-phosphate phosphatase CheZ
MEKIDLQGLLNKAEELKVVDFLQEVIVFVREVSPILESMSYSIKESVTKMPSASKKLSQVTEATEMATTEILNVVDGLFVKTGDISTNLNNIPEKSEYIDKSNEILQSVNEDLTNIMMSLQVQDITSQQIAAVNHILETIQSKLGTILSRFNTKEIIAVLGDEFAPKDGGNISTLHRPIAFDPRALDAITMGKTRQDAVDDMMQKLENGTLKEDDMTEEFSAEDIDSLFGGDDSIKKVAFSEEQPADSADEFSQDDIDAMFG